MNQYGVNDDVTKSIDKVQEEVRDYVIMLTLQREELGFYQITLQQHSWPSFWSFFAFAFVAIVLLYCTFWWDYRMIKQSTGLSTSFRRTSLNDSNIYLLMGNLSWFLLCYFSDIIKK